VDNVIPFAVRRVWFEGTPIWPLFIAFLTTSVNDENDEADLIGSFCLSFVFDEILESIMDTVCDLDAEIEFDDDELDNNELFDESDETISANGVHRLFSIDDDVDDVVGPESVGASELSENFGSE